MKTTLRMMLKKYGWVGVAAGIGLCVPVRCLAADPDLPGAVPNMEDIPAGSYVIPMDTTRQNIITPFNMKAYGLINALLHANVPVKWAIKAGKAKDAADFSAYVQRFSPSAAVAGPATFYTGPFIVEQTYTNVARSIISSYGNSVAVYQILSNVTVDVRYTLNHKPQIAIFDDGGKAAIHEKCLTDGGFPVSDYEIYQTATILNSLGTTTCVTFASSPHWQPAGEQVAQVAAVRSFIQSGGNFLGQCEGVAAYENIANGHFQSTAGIFDNEDSGTSFTYPNADMAFCQFLGNLDDQGGSLQEWGLNPGSSWTNRAYSVVNCAAKANAYRATVSKLDPDGIGSVMFSLGGHSYQSTSDMTIMNGTRMYLNAVFVPSDRPGSCGVTFTVDLELTKSPSNLVMQVGSNVTFTVAVTNKGPGNATGVSVKDILPPAFSNVSATASSGVYTNATGIWGIGNMNRYASASLQITATATQPGVITNTAQVWTVFQGDPDSTPGNSVPTGDDQGTSVVIVEAADLSLTKTVNNAAPNVGNNVTFTVAVSNAGPRAATSVTVQDILPAGLSFVSAGSGTYNSGSGIWTIGMLNAGATTSLTITATVLVTNVMINTAQVWTSAPQFDPDSTPGNSVPSEDDQASVKLTPQVSDLSLTKTVNNASPNVGNNVIFTVAVSNAGPSAVTGA
ncbi:MAG: DUF11 domain-containing protein, partial [bacterium]